MKTSNLTNTFDMVSTALDLADVLKDGYIYASTASSLAWSFLRNTATIEDLEGRRKLTAKQEDLLDNLKRDISDTESMLRWSHNQALAIRGSAPNYNRTVENIAGFKSKSEFRADANVMYAVLPEAPRRKAVDNYVEGMDASARLLCEDHEAALARVTNDTTPEAIDPNWFLTRFIVNGVLRNLEDYTTTEGVIRVAERAGFDVPTKTQHMLSIPIAEFAFEEIGGMQARINEHLEMANGESGSLTEIH